MFEQAPKNQKLPYHLESEKAVLGAILRSSESILLIEGMLEPKHFYLDAHKKIYSSIVELSAQSEPIDIVTVSEKLRKYQTENDHLGAAYLVDLTESSPVSQNIEHYAKIVQANYYLRRVITACYGTIERAMSAEGPVEKIVDEVEKEFLSIAQENDRKGIVSADKVLEATIEDIQRRMEREDEITGVPTGFKKLDGLTGGLQKSDLIILAARPAMGKTALALNLATNAALAKKSVVIFTLEMSKEQLMSRVLSSVARVDSSRLRKGDLSSEEQDLLMEGARKIYESRNYLGIDETPGITLMELRSRCRRYHKEKGLDLVVIDYLQLMGSAGRKNDNREREISEISMGLKALAKELAIPVVALAQLNRGPDARTDKRPKISDLRESGSMEQDADLVLFVYRDEYYNPSSEAVGIAEVLIGKNRHGPIDTVKLAFQPNFVAFQNLFMESEDTAH
jgi:replicative DNA helicase